jgi:hypothetical protein
MMVLVVGRWPRHLSSLHRFDELVDKIAICIESWVVDMEPIAWD